MQSHSASNVRLIGLPDNSYELIIRLVFITGQLFYFKCIRLNSCFHNRLVKQFVFFPHHEIAEITAVFFESDEDLGNLKDEQEKSSKKKNSIYLYSRWRPLITILHVISVVDWRPISPRFVFSKIVSKEYNFQQLKILIFTISLYIILQTRKVRSKPSKLVI